ncbi:MAG: hypothetical protein JSS07_10075 [Proteobacteria bacterium]|nr:hypothetical protein [Pseudomonadota bacterium]
MTQISKINISMLAWPHQVKTNKGLITHEKPYQPHQIDLLLQSQLFSSPFKLAFQSLAPKERAALILRYQQHHSQSQIATMLGLSTERFNQFFENVLHKLSHVIFFPV